MTRARLLILAVLVGTLSALAQDGESQPKQGLAFAWPIPSKAVVTQASLKKGKRGTIRYTIELKPKGDELELSFADLTFITIDGQDCTSPEMQAQLAPFLASAQAAMPPMRVSAAGDYLGIADWDAFVDRCIEVFAKINPEQGAQFGKALKSPTFRQTLEPTVAKYWLAWSGAWVGYDLAPGEAAEVNVELPIGDALVSAPTKAERLPDEEGFLRLRQRTVLEGPEANRAFKAFMLKMTSEGPNPMTADQLAGLEFRKETELEASLDPKTLRPRVVKTRERTVMGTAADGKREQLETAEYTFEWKD